MSTSHETKLNATLSTMAGRAHHSIDRLAGVAKTAENDVLTGVRDGVTAAKDARSSTQAGLVVGRSQARSMVSTVTERAAQHPGFLFAAGAALAVGAVLISSAFRRR